MKSAEGFVGDQLPLFDPEGCVAVGGGDVGSPEERNRALDGVVIKGRYYADTIDGAIIRQGNAGDIEHRGKYIRADNRYVTHRTGHDPARPSHHARDPDSSLVTVALPTA